MEITVNKKPPVPVKEEIKSVVISMSRDEYIILLALTGGVGGANELASFAHAVWRERDKVQPEGELIVEDPYYNKIIDLMKKYKSRWFEV